MEVKNSIREKALHLISKYFGTTAEDLYRKFYEDKSDEVIIDSVEELLIEYLGEKKASGYVKELKRGL